MNIKSKTIQYEHGNLTLTEETGERTNKDVWACTVTTKTYSNITIQTKDGEVLFDGDKETVSRVFDILTVYLKEKSEVL